LIKSVFQDRFTLNSVPLSQPNHDLDRPTRRSIIHLQGRPGEGAQRRFGVRMQQATDPVETVLPREVEAYLRIQGSAVDQTPNGALAAAWRAYFTHHIAELNLGVAVARVRLEAKAFE
jgi:homoserine acetyltransferase